jgi:hypothetical protein
VSLEGSGTYHKEIMKLPVTYSSSWCPQGTGPQATDELYRQLLEFLLAVGDLDWAFKAHMLQLSRSLSQFETQDIKTQPRSDILSFFL